MHATIRAVLLPEIVRLIADEHGWAEEEAMDRFYGSATGASFSDDESGLYGRSALFISSLFAEEMKDALGPAGVKELTGSFRRRDPL